MLLQGIFGAGAHSDYGMLTLLKTDQHPGLQIWSKGHFVDVPPRDGMFIVNLGDMLERWPHRNPTQLQCLWYAPLGRKETAAPWRRKCMQAVQAWSSSRQNCLLFRASAPEGLPRITDATQCCAACRWTNGRFRSTLHRVVVDGSADRYSIPFFFEPNFDTQVECLPSCCSPDHPPRHACPPPIACCSWPRCCSSHMQ